MGFFLTEVEDVDLIRGEMDRRWGITNSVQIPRFRDDLEAAWDARGLPGSNGGVRGANFR